MSARRPDPEQGKLFGTAVNAAQPSLLAGSGGFPCEHCHGRGWRSIRSKGEWLNVMCAYCRGAIGSGSA